MRCWLNMRNVIGLPGYARSHSGANPSSVITTVSPTPVAVSIDGVADGTAGVDVEAATGSAVLYLPAEKILVTGDVLVSPEDGQGPPPWTTNSFAITPWLVSLRRLEALETTVIVPGQGPAMHDRRYLSLTVQLFAGIVHGVQRALERGVYKADDIVAAVNLDAIGAQYPGGATGPGTPFASVVSRLIRKAAQEGLDGVVK